MLYLCFYLGVKFKSGPDRCLLRLEENQVLSPAPSPNAPAGATRFFRCISASYDRETDTRTLYFY
jgi:hypothetical protein